MLKDDSSYKGYRNLLSALKEKYRFTNFTEVNSSPDQLEKVVLLRHDIDFSLEKAQTMAEIESENGIQATYFLLLNSPFYNLFYRKSREIVRNIINLGHNIGLHYDYFDDAQTSISTVLKELDKEINLLEDLYEIRLDGVSFHRPLSLDFLAKLSIPSYPHTYEKLFLENFKYLSDSRGIWRYGHPLKSDAFKNNDNLHLLIHPMWWNEVNIDDLPDMISLTLSEIYDKIESYSKEELANTLKDYEKRKK